MYNFHLETVHKTKTSQVNQKLSYHFFLFFKFNLKHIHTYIPTKQLPKEAQDTKTQVFELHEKRGKKKVDLPDLRWCVPIHKRSQTHDRKIYNLKTQKTTRHRIYLPHFLPPGVEAKSRT